MDLWPSPELHSLAPRASSISTYTSFHNSAYSAALLSSIQPKAETLDFSKALRTMRTMAALSSNLIEGFPFFWWFSFLCVQVIMKISVIHRMIKLDWIWSLKLLLHVQCWRISLPHQLQHIIIIETVPHMIIVSHNSVQLVEWIKANSFGCLAILAVRGSSPGMIIWISSPESNRRLFADCSLIWTNFVSDKRDLYIAHLGRL